MLSSSSFLFLVDMRLRCRKDAPKPFRELVHCAVWIVGCDVGPLGFGLRVVCAHG